MDIDLGKIPKIMSPNFLMKFSRKLKKNQKKKKNSQNPKIKIKNTNFAKVKFLKSVSNFMRNLAEILPKKSFQKILKSKKKILKIYHFFDRFFFTPAAVLFLLEQSSILLGRIHALGRLSNNKELVHFHSQSTTKY